MTEGRTDGAVPAKKHESEQLPGSSGSCFQYNSVMALLYSVNRAVE